jgi:hypothetical protein
MRTEYQINRLKNRARTSAAMYNSLMAQVDCGHKMLQEISSDACQWAKQFDSAMEELEKLDPLCPQSWTRLSVNESNRNVVRPQGKGS